MTKVRRITQLQLDGFASLLQDAEEAGQDQTPLSMAEIKQREMAARFALKEKLNEGEMPSWAEKYHELLNSNIPWKIAAFIAWSVVIKTHRWPATQEELAREVLGLTSDRRITEWRRKYPYIDQMIADLQVQEYFVYIPGSIKASGEVASIADYKSTAERRLLWEATGLIEKNTKVTVEGNNSVTKDLLSRLDKTSTAKIIELLGSDALDMIEQLKEEIENEEEPSPLVAGYSDVSPNSESTNLGKDVQDVDDGAA